MLSARATGAAIVPLQLLLRAGDKNVRMVPDMVSQRGGPRLHARLLQAEPFRKSAVGRASRGVGAGRARSRFL